MTSSLFVLMYLRLEDNVPYWSFCWPDHDFKHLRAYTLQARWLCTLHVVCWTDHDFKPFHPYALKARGPCTLSVIFQPDHDFPHIGLNDRLSKYTHINNGNYLCNSSGVVTVTQEKLLQVLIITIHGELKVKHYEDRGGHVNKNIDTNFSYTII